jgi:hypothetical protein
MVALSMELNRSKLFVKGLLRLERTLHLARTSLPSS